MSEIIMYTTTWCGDCRRAKSYFERKGIQYIEKNIEDTPGAAELVMSVNNGKRKVPTFVVGQDTFHNSPYSEALMEEKFGK